MKLGRIPPLSLKHYLLWWTMGMKVLVWSVLLVAVWHVAEHEAEEITDGQLISVARLWLLTEPTLSNQASPLIVPDRIRPYVQDVAVVRMLNNRIVVDTHRLPVDWSTQTHVGFADIEIAMHGELRIWRVYQTQQMTEQGPERLAALMKIDHRNDLAWDMLQQMLAPVWVIFPLSLLLLVWAVSQAIKPLQNMIDDIDALQGAPDEMLQTQPPFHEFQNTVRAIDGLLQKLNTQRAHERAFASDVAHELRTPLTSIALQSHMLGLQYSPKIAKELEAEALKAGAILSQLLVLARAESSRTQAFQMARLSDLVERITPVLEKLATQYSQQLSIQNHLNTEAWIYVEPIAVELVIKNLVDNSLRHTPPNSRIEVRLVDNDSRVTLEVEDWPVENKSFSGSQTGLGLGLQLVQRLLACQDGQLHIEQKSQSGRLTQVSWPMTNP